MPHRPPLGEDSDHTSRDASVEPQQPRRPSMWGRLAFPRFHWRKRDGAEQVSEAQQQQQQQTDGEQDKCADGAALSPQTSPTDRRPPLSVIPHLPRATTFSRQESERRERLFPHEPCPHERRQISVSRRRALSASPRAISPMIPSALRSAPDVRLVSLNAAVNSLRGGPDADDGRLDLTAPEGAGGGGRGGRDNANGGGDPYRFQPSTCGDGDQDYDTLSDITNDPTFREELDERWVLNLSMHFRDQPDREKFFITYAEEPNKWRRVTVSCNYSNAERDTLEADLKTLHFQREKSARIYGSIRESLPDIQFYDTVTNLKLTTEDKRLHVHVTEDVNEIIPYPPLADIEHLEDCTQFPESAINFEAHLSGFVYKVSVGSAVYIKKEIPSRDAVDEFLYEVNALYSLRNSRHVICFRGVVVDDAGTCIKGLLIDFADGGSLVDVLLNAKNLSIDWSRREKWARQVIQGLADIHEHGFVQGDFTLSNIVVTSADNAEIIDINRRGCPVGWEPPELEGLIRSRQRISMYIGNKTDIFQLGMVLWALAKQNDEPEREDLGVPFDDEDWEDIPAYFRRVVETCLASRPADRKSAKELLLEFPPEPLQNGHVTPQPEADEIIERPKARAAPELHMHGADLNGNDILRPDNTTPVGDADLADVGQRDMFTGSMRHQDSGFGDELDDAGAGASSSWAAAVFARRRGRSLSARPEMLSELAGVGACVGTYDEPQELVIGDEGAGAKDGLSLARAAGMAMDLDLDLGLGLDLDLESARASRQETGQRNGEGTSG